MLLLRQAPTVTTSLRRQVSCSASTYVRGIAHSAQRTASVSNASLTTSNKAPPPGDAVAEPEKAPLERPAHLAPQVLEAKRARKLAQYEQRLQEKAKREGFSSVEEMVAKEKERKRVSAVDNASPAAATSSLTPQDAKLADDLLKRVEAEAQRKIKSGNFSSGPGVKTLGDILDMTKVHEDTPADTIAQLWTQYHTLKNKLSAVIPARQYADMLLKARQYPQFILPLPRTIVGSLDTNETANVAPGERKNGFEMQYMEWGFLPKPEVAAPESAQDARLSDDDVQAILRAPPATVLFTPLAEYKLRQEYAQPVLILTHYTDLAISKGIVLLRGEVSEVKNDGAPAPTGVAAAVAASHAGETSAEKLENLKKPLQSQGKLSQQDAQLLTVMLQRFYLPKAKEAPSTPGDAQRQQLLEAFHGDQDRFDLDLLCKCALEI